MISPGEHITSLSILTPIKKESIVSKDRLDGHLRTSTRDFLIDACNVISTKLGNLQSTGLNRYYQIRVNSLYDPDHDSINRIKKIAENNTNCLLCGNACCIRLHSRNRLNHSNSRKHCKYLRCFCDEFCDKCKSSTRHKLYSPRQIQDKLHKIDNQNAKVKVKNDSIAPPPPPTKSENKSRLSAEDQTVNTKSARKQKSQPTLPPPPKIKPPPAQFSSRLRAFSCLLKD